MIYLVLYKGRMDNKKRGRPQKDGQHMLEPITIRLPPQMMREIEKRMAERLDMPSKLAFIRELLAKGLEAS